MRDTNRDVAGPILEVESLSKDFVIRGAPTVHAVRDVSFELGAGRALGVIGESGSGKTTLARMVLGLESATAGRVRFEGEELDLSGRTAKRRHLARRIQVVFQDPYSSLDPLQTVGSMLTEVFRHHRGAAPSHGELVSAVTDVGLPESTLDQRPGRLSGGQRQRVAIARALAPEPDLLVLDEAVSALDVSVQAQILNLVNRVRRQRALSLVFITHDLGVVRQTCDDVVVMWKGEVVDAGPIADVLDEPRHPYTRALRAAVTEPGWDAEEAAQLIDAALD